MGGCLFRRGRGAEVEEEEADSDSGEELSSTRERVEKRFCTTALPAGPVVFGLENRKRGIIEGLCTTSGLDGRNYSRLAAFLDCVPQPPATKTSTAQAWNIASVFNTGNNASLELGVSGKLKLGWGTGTHPFGLSLWLWLWLRFGGSLGSRGWWACWLHPFPKSPVSYGGAADALQERHVSLHSSGDAVDAVGVHTANSGSISQGELGTPIPARVAPIGSADGCPGGGLYCYNGPSSRHLVFFHGAVASDGAAVGAYGHTSPTSTGASAGWRSGGVHGGGCAGGCAAAALGSSLSETAQVVWGEDGGGTAGGGVVEDFHGVE